MNRTPVLLALCGLALAPWSLPAQSVWIGNTDTNMSNAANWSAGVPNNTQGTFTTPGSSGSSVEMTADIQFGGGTAPGSNALLFDGSAFTITGNSGTRQLTIGGQGLAIGTTSTITLDVPRVRRNASNTFEFLGSGGNLVINGAFSTNVTSASATQTNVDFTGASGSNNTLTFNGNIEKIFAPIVAGDGLASLTTRLQGSNTDGTVNRVIFNNPANNGLFGTLTIGAGTEVHLGSGTANGTLAGLASIVNNGTFTINQNDAVTQGTDFSAAGISGGGVLRQAGTGTTTLNVANTFSGGIQVTGGRLIVASGASVNTSLNGVSITGGALQYDAAGALAGTVTVNGGALVYNSGSNLSGTLNFISGTVGGSNLNGVTLSIGTNQTLSPGNSTGTLSAGATTWANGGTFVFELNDATGTAGSAVAGWDLFSPTTLDLTAGAGQFTINLATLTSGQVAGLAQNFDAQSDFSWLFVDAGSAITGFGGDEFTLNTSGFQNAFNGTFAVTQGTGLDTDKLYISYTAVPEPTTLAVLVMTFVAFLIARRRKLTAR